MGEKEVRKEIERVFSGWQGMWLVKTSPAVENLKNRLIKAFTTEVLPDEGAERRG